MSFESFHVCAGRSCQGPVRIALIHDGKTEGFVGGMASGRCKHFYFVGGIDELQAFECPTGGEYQRGQHQHTSNDLVSAHSIGPACSRHLSFGIDGTARARRFSRPPDEYLV
jgi:hypothetical protein